MALREPNWPARVTQISNAYHNQLETPLLFYVLILLAMITETADFDPSRLELAVRRLALRARLYPPHLQSPPARASVFLVGAIGLALMWVIVAARLTIAAPSG